MKRGLADDLVVAPYATLLAAPLVPLDVLRNLERLAAEGLAGRYGFYEAIDYTPERKPEGARGVVLPTYMAHHQGMSLVALDNALHDAPMQQRFHADPRVQAADLLLQERIPHLVPLKNLPIEIADHVPTARRVAPSVRRYATPHTLSPRAHLLSNGSYIVMVTNAGGGYSRRQQVALTRWREDVTTDAWGSFCYVRDLDAGDVWSATYQPTAREPEEYEVTFAPDRAAWRRLDAGIETRTEVVVSPEDDAELRRVSLTNHSAVTRSLELTSYAEVVLAPADADLSHPAFSNLFIETRSVPERDALICVRRPRSGGQRLYLVHVLSGRGRMGVATQYETDRARFIGRGGTLERPAALSDKAALSGHDGPRPRPHRQPPAVAAPAPRRDRAVRVHDRVCRERRSRAAPDREVPRSPRGGTRAGAGQHAQPDRAAAPQPDRRGHASRFSASAAACSRETRGCATGTPSRRTGEASASCGSTASPEIFRFCSSASPARMRRRWSSSS